MKTRNVLPSCMVIVALCSMNFKPAAANEMLESHEQPIMSPLSCVHEDSISAPASKFTKRLQQLAAVLDLTDAQLIDITSIIATEKNVILPLVVRLWENRIFLQTMQREGEFFEDTVRNAAADQAYVLTELIVIKQRIRSKVASVLTPEQIEKANRLRELILEDVITTG